MIRVYYTLKLISFCFFYWTIGDGSADRLYLATTATATAKNAGRNQLIFLCMVLERLVWVKAQIIACLREIKNIFYQIHGLNKEKISYFLAI
jgi:hypothetical protein